MAVISLPRVLHNRDRQRASATCIGSLETSAGRIRLTIFRDFESIEKQWQSLQANGVCVHEHLHALNEAWFRLVSKPGGAELAIVCGYSESGDVQFIWPFEVMQKRGLRCLCWIGWEHANYNMGLHTLDFARTASAEDIRALLSEAACLIGGVSAAYLKQQPYEWDGVKNPMARLPHRPSANMGHAILLESDFDTLYRNRFSGKSRNTLGRKERRLREQYTVEMGWAHSTEERAKLIEEFFRQKSQQFTEQGITDTFADPRHRAFYHEMAALPSGNPGALQIGYLKADSQIAAISCGIFFKDRFATLLTSIDDGPVRRHSPGALLLHFQIEDACRRGLNFFDMGVGDSRHKQEWCDVDTPLFESIISFDERGYLLTLPLTARLAAKRYIKTRPKLWSLAQTMRRTLYGQNRKSHTPTETAADRLS